MEVVTIFLTALAILLTYFIIRQMTYWSSRKVPHLRPIPLIGNTTSFFTGSQSPAEFSRQIYLKHPEIPYIGLMSFNTPVLLINSPELIKEIFIKNFDNNPDHLSFITEEFDPILGKNVFSLRGDRWRQVRGALTPTFTATKMKFLFTLMAEVSKNVINYLEDHPQDCELLDAKDLFTRYANDVIATSAFGLSVDSLKDRTNEFYLRGKDATNLTGISRIFKFVMGMMFPRIMRLLGQSYLSKDTNRFFVDLIREEVKRRDLEKVVRPDMIHLLMQARGNNIGSNDIVAQAFIFFLAGFDTTSTLMSFVIHQLAFHQDIQEKLHQEVEFLEEINYEDLGKLKFLEMIILETLRFFPPIVLLDRVCSKRFKLPPPPGSSTQLDVEEGTVLWAPTFAMQRDNKYFPDPETFDPERFAEENKGNVDPCVYMPFGVGPRKCIGERFAMMEIKLMLARLVKNFRILPSEKSNKEIVFDKKSLNLVPKGGIWVKFERRKV
ncbi:GSCOCT00013998001.2-RA-CDS [Cotesia congregata]|uniref:CYP9BV1 n=1 Tax=Cotesia congregata TaxID=51543 RepID=A0A8J2E9X8_COTCN|nr:GSCOCT00013998001.2-RA-CDS [Cotesia congregata]CAG5074861.1 CYP9BV1 [Cotesia congregata]